jgi:CRISPR/Cas system CMR subunit Cmr4 (Cas7 group RAMP superfamily)
MSIEIDPKVRKVAVLWIENYVPNGSIMPEIAQKFKLAEDIQRLVNEASKEAFEAGFKKGLLEKGNLPKRRGA